MRAGKLDRTITIQAWDENPEPDDYGTVTPVWVDFATLRAQIIEASTEEYQRAYGEGGNTAVVFRTRWQAGVTVGHRVVYDGKGLNIRDLKEIGRRKGLELRCEEVRS
jgi:SPP1 family predicted phage head-tail adaptor